MMGNMSHTMTAEKVEFADMQKAPNSMSCCDDIMMQENLECCDTSCQCSIGAASFMSIIKATMHSLQTASLRLVSSAIDRPGDIYLKRVQRPPIYFIP
jgi:formylmethanofuran dehydrogenase subunit B